MSLSPAIDRVALPRHLSLLASDWEALRDAVRDWAPDLIVTVARRAPRTDEVLNLRLADIATTITDLALPFATPYITGARVAVVDDIINVGSTLDNATRILRRQGASDYAMFALRSRKSADGLDEVQDHITLVGDDPLSEQRCTALAQQAPALIAQLNKSYDLDFPIMACTLASPYRDASELHAACIEKFGDHVFDLSTSSGLAEGLHRYTVDWRDDDGIFCKARIYFDQKTGLANVVPMRINNPMRTAAPANEPAWVGDIRALLIAPLGDVGERDEALARVELYLDSLQFGIAFLQEMSGVLRPAQANLVSAADAELIFGPTASQLDVPATLLDQPAARVNPALATDPTRGTSPAFQNLWQGAFRDEVKRVSKSTDPMSHAVALFAVLARWVGSEHVKKYQMTWPFTSAEVDESPYRRLRIGFTFTDLMTILEDLAVTERPATAWRRTTSKILDRLIDAGTVVPTIAKFDGKFYRIYRKGEADARDAAVERFLLGVEEYRQAASATRLSKIGVIVSYLVPPDSAAHVAAEPRGYVLSLDPDVLDDGAEITQYLRRVGKMPSASRDAE